MSKRTKDYYDCFADQYYDNDQEALFTKHVEEHAEQPDGNCFWCELGENYARKWRRS